MRTKASTVLSQTKIKLNCIPVTRNERADEIAKLVFPILTGMLFKRGRCATPGEIYRTVENMSIADSDSTCKYNIKIFREVESH